MSNVFSSRTGAPVTAVALAPVNDSYYEDFTLEPAMVRQRAPNSAYLYTSSDDVVTISDPPNNCVVATPGDGVLMRKVKRMGLTFMQLALSTPVIDSTNNIMYMFDSTTALMWTITIPMGNWNTPQLLAQAFNKGCTTATAGALVGTAVTFTWYFSRPPNPVAPAYAPSFPEPLTQFQVTLEASSPVLFLSESPAMRFGDCTYGWPVVDTPIWDRSQPVGGQAALYTSLCFTLTTMFPPCLKTRWVDVISTTLTKWSKLSSASTSAGPNSLIYRIYCPPFDGYPTDPGEIRVGPLLANNTAIIYRPQRNIWDSNIGNPITWTMNVDENISTIDYQIRDQYGNNIYTVPSYYSNNTTPGTPSTSISSRSPSVWDGGLAWEMGYYCEI